MSGRYVIYLFQIGDAARHFKYAVLGARGEVEAADRLLQQLDTLLFRDA